MKAGMIQTVSNLFWNTHLDQQQSEWIPTTKFNVPMTENTGLGKHVGCLQGNMAKIFRVYLYPNSAL